MPESPTASERLLQPTHRLLGSLALRPLRQLGPVHHDDGYLQRPGGFNLGVGIGTTGILADDAINGMVLEQCDFILDLKRPARNDQLIAVCGQGQSLFGLIHHPQHEVMLLSLACKSCQLLATNGQKDTSITRLQSLGCGSHVRHPNPAVSGLQAPARALHGEQRNSRRRTGGNGIAAHLRRKRMCGIDHMTDLLVSQIGKQALDATKATHPHRQCRSAPRLGCSRIGVHRSNARFMQFGRQNIGIKSAA